MFAQMILTSQEVIELVDKDKLTSYIKELNDCGVELVVRG